MAELTRKELDLAPFGDVLTSIKEMMRKKPRANPPVPKAIPKAISEDTIKQTPSHRTEEPPIYIDKGEIVCNYETAAIIARILQFAVFYPYPIFHRIANPTMVLWLLMA